MNFNRGDQVVHRDFGVGTVVTIELMSFSHNQLRLFYRVEFLKTTIWVPVSEASDNRLRLPTPPGDFEALFAILSSPAQPLSDDRNTRKTQLSDQLKDGKLASVCQALRDLTFHLRTKKINEDDKAVMERAQNFLLNEWALSLSVSVAQAKKQLQHLLGEETS